MKVNNSEKTLLKNTGIIGIGVLLAKVLTFFLLPLYTSYLKPDDYGNVDVLITFSNFILPFITLELGSALFRFLIQNKDFTEHSTLISSAFFMIMITTFIFVIISVIVNCIFDFDYLWSYVFYIISFVFVLFFQNTLRGFGNNKMFSVFSLLSTFFTFVLSIYFIIYLRMGAESIMISNTVANFITLFIFFLIIKIWRYINFNKISYNILFKMLKYSVPLIPNSISWWVANASDRLLIYLNLSNYSNGIYAAANKIPAIYTSVFNVFNIAWTETCSREVDMSSNIDNILLMFSKCIKIFGCLCICIISAISLFFNVLINDNYFDAYNHIYILMVAIFFNSLCSLMGGILTAYKDSKSIGYTTIVGAIFNIFINLMLINSIGLYAASISTLVSYIIIFIIRNIKVHKYIKLKYPYKYIFSMIVALLIASFAFFYVDVLIRIIVFILILIWSVISNKDFIFSLLDPLLKKIGNFNNN